MDEAGRIKALKDEEQAVKDEAGRVKALKAEERRGRERVPAARMDAHEAAEYLGLLAGTALAAVLFWLGPPSRWVGHDPTPPSAPSDVQFYSFFSGLVLAWLVSRFLARRSALVRVVVVAVWVMLGELFVITSAAKLFWMAVR